MKNKGKPYDGLVQDNVDFKAYYDRYIRLVENARDMIYRMSIPGGIYEYVSPASNEIFGYEPEVFYNTPELIRETIHPDFLDYFQKEWNNLLNDKMPEIYEYKIIHKSGEERWLNQRNALVKDEKGNPVAIEGIVTDITLRKNAELERDRLAHDIGERAKELNCLYKISDYSYENIGIDEFITKVISIIPPSFQYPETTEVKLEIDSKEYKSKNYKPSKWSIKHDIFIGGKKNGFIEINYQDEMPEHNHGPFLTEELHLINGISELVGRTLEFKINEKELKEKYEEYLSINEELKEKNNEYLALNEEYMAQNEELNVLNEEYRLMNEELIKKEERLKEAQKIAQIGHWELDIVNNKLEWSDQIYRIFDLKPQQFKATYEAFLDSIHPDDREMVNKAYTDSLKNKTPYQIEHRLLLKGTKIKYVLEKCNTEYDDSGTPLRSIGTVQDITDDKRKQKIKEAQLRLYDFSENNSTTDLLQKFLDEAEVLTESKVGFYHFVEEDQNTLSLQAWSTNTLENMCNAEGEGTHYSINEAGVWVDCVREGKPVIHNDYKSLKHKKGMPEGHAPIIREMVVPVIREKKIVAILGVGNKESEYTDVDTQIVQELADVAWETVMRKKTQEKLLINEEKHRQLLENLNAAVVVHNSKTEITYANSKASELLDVTESQLFGKTAMDPNWYFFRDDGAVMPFEEYPVNVVLKTKKPLQNYVVGLNRPRIKDQIWVLVNAYPVFIKEKIDHVIVTFIDITKNKEVETKIKQSEEKFRSVFEHSSVGKSMAGMDGNQMVNQAFCNIIGYTAEELNNKDWKEYTHAGDIQKSTDIVKSLLNGEKDYAHYEKRLIHKNGSIVYTDVQTTLLRDNNKTPQYFITAFTDITDKKNAQIVLQNTLKELERSNQELEQFAYVASHDLQEPLRKVKNFAELFAKKYNNIVDEKGGQYINYITTGADRMQNLVLDLLSFSRVSTRGKDFVPTDLNETIQKVVDNLQLSIEENEAQIIIDDLPILKVDESQMSQVFQNLISNAIKFRSKDPPVIKISVNENKNYWQFAFRDNGIGMDMKYQERIFEVFQRLHTKEEYKGTGIGLAICKKIIERHNGKIWFESELENLPAGKQGGSTFYFTIPKKIK